MSEYQKPFEYQEEKGMTGFLLVFFLMLLTIELLLAAATVVQGYRAFGDSLVLRTVIGAAGCAYLLLILATSVALRRRFPLGAALSKVLLVVRVPLLAPVHVVLFARSPAGTLVTGLIAPVGYIVLFSAAWFVFFLKSRRVRQLNEASRKRS